MDWVVCGGAEEQTLALVIVFFLEKNTVSSQLKLNFFPHFLEKIVSIDNCTVEKTKRFEGSNIECLITLELHKTRSGHVQKRSFKKQRYQENQLPLKTSLCQS